MAGMDYSIYEDNRINRLAERVTKEAYKLEGRLEELETRVNELEDTGISINKIAYAIAKKIA